jgi:hypothetical protein
MEDPYEHLIKLSTYKKLIEMLEDKSLVINLETSQKTNVKYYKITIEGTNKIAYGDTICSAINTMYELVCNNNEIIVDGKRYREVKDND